ncbi:MAG: HD domain-containing protein [Microcystis aeruginosa W13-11]|jgi:(p)ppGpp synthase/HD superfamily hydrolase|nr:HD domain-containing protein [Microcystis aeruginosa W13-11]
MYLFAQTNLQLFNQLHKAGYTEADLVCIHQSYQLASRLFTGFFRGSGKPFINHLVGTASILVSVNAPIDVIAGGLLHAVYEFGDFGDGARGITAKKQAQIRKIMGESIESYIAKYTALNWQENNIINLYRNLDKLEQQQKEVLLMRLANELEDHLDGGILYCGNAQKRLDYLNYCGNLIIEMAKKLDYPELANILSQVFQETFSLNISTALQNKYPYSYLLPTSSPLMQFMGRWRYRALSGTQIILNQINFNKFKEFLRF